MESKEKPPLLRQNPKVKPSLQGLRFAQAKFEVE
jgi:hypothetical protein